MYGKKKSKNKKKKKSKGGYKVTAKSNLMKSKKIKITRKLSIMTSKN